MQSFLVAIFCALLFIPNLKPHHPDAYLPSLIPSDTIKARSDTFFKANGFAFTGDSEAFKRIKALHYFTNEFRFGDYPSFKMKIVPAPINSRPTKLISKYKSILSTEYKRKGINFAGHYSIVWLRNNTTYMEGAIIDAKNGNSYDLPIAELDGVAEKGKAFACHPGYRFRRNSRLLIVNPVDSSGYYDVTQMINVNKTYIWNERSKKFLRIN